MNKEWKRIADMLPGFKEVTAWAAGNSPEDRANAKGIFASLPGLENTVKGRIIREALEEEGFAFSIESQRRVAQLALLDPADYDGLPCDCGNATLPTNLLSGAPYVPAAETDVRKTMDRERKRLGIPIPRGRK